MNPLRRPSSRVNALSGAADPGCTAGFQRHDATGSRWIEPLTAPQNRLVENKWFIGAVTGEPALSTAHPVSFRRRRLSLQGPSPTRAGPLSAAPSPKTGKKVTKHYEIVY
jgi:hypothetical protein